jgi:hypothetical protein
MSERIVFRWTCLLVVAAFLGGVLWMANDLRVEIKSTTENVNQATTTVNTRLPEIINKAEVGVDTFADLSADVDRLKQVIGLGLEKTNARYSDHVKLAKKAFELIAQSGGTLSRDKDVGFGKQSYPAEEWVIAQRSEIPVLAIIATSDEEFLYRMTRSTLLDKPWSIKLPNQSSVLLLDWLKEQLKV